MGKHTYTYTLTPTTNTIELESTNNDSQDLYVDVVIVVVVVYVFIPPAHKKNSPQLFWPLTCYGSLFAHSLRFWSIYFICLLCVIFCYKIKSLSIC